MMVKHVKWCVDVGRWKPTRDEWLKLTSCVAQDELARINRFVYQDDSKTALIGRILIRNFLAQVTNQPSNELRLIRNEYGRPQVCKEYADNLGSAWPRTLDFNISHSGNFCVLAGLWDETVRIQATVGVDVSRIVRKQSKQELARFLELMSRREFLPSEWRTVGDAIDDEEKCVNFTRLWCLKESFIKSIGLGLSFRLNRICFEPQTPANNLTTLKSLKRSMFTGTKVRLDGQLASDWSFLETALDDQHLVAIGYNTQDNQFRLDESRIVEKPMQTLLDPLGRMTEPLEENWREFCSKSIK